MPSKIKTIDKLAFIILNYFGVDHTKKCIGSILPNNEIHIFIVENSNSQREKEKIINLFSEESVISLIFPSTNLGFSRGINLALARAIDEGYEKFVILNNDAFLVDGAVKKFQEAINLQPKTLISPLIEWDNKVVGNVFYHKYLTLLSYSNQKGKTFWMKYLTGCCLLFDIHILKNNQLLDEYFFMYGEDIALSYRIINSNYKIRLLDEVLVIHAGSLSAKKSSLFYEYHVNRGHILLVKAIAKNNFEKIMMYILRFIVLSIKGLWRSIKYRTTYPLLASFLIWFPLKIRPQKQ